MVLVQHHQITLTVSDTKYLEIITDKHGTIIIAYAVSDGIVRETDAKNITVNAEGKLILE